MALAIPVTLALTLVFYLIGYTLNRITLFALIFSIGILVDDAIVVVENVVRHFPKMRPDRFRRWRSRRWTRWAIPPSWPPPPVIAAILPMAFVGGLMGPYMRPIPVGASAAMLFSLLVAFIVTPWLSLVVLKGTKTGGGKANEGGRVLAFLTGFIKRRWGPFWRSRKRRIRCLSWSSSCSWPRSPCSWLS